jgi:polar amino acid transport system substrate-binding protein
VTPPAVRLAGRARAAFALLSIASAACGSSMPADVLEQLAPDGTIRAALNFANPVLATRAEAEGQPGGIAAELARELGRRLGVPVEYRPYDSAAAMADAAPKGEWDIAFLAADPAREAAIAFTAPYLELEATYLVPADSRFRALADLDAEGVRIAARPRSAYDLFLRRSLRRATLVYPEGSEADLDVLTSGRADAMAGLTHMLVGSAADVPGLRVIEGRFASMQQAIGVPQGRPAAAAYLREFVEQVKASGFVASLIAASGAPGVAVAPVSASPAPPSAGR